MDFIDPTDDYVPHLQLLIITSSFSSNHEEDNMADDAIEVNSSDQDSGNNLVISWSALKQNNQEF